MKDKEITHSGVVLEVNDDVINITIEANSACAGCHAKGSCNMSEKSDKIVEVKNTKHYNLKVGDTVTVVITKEAGIYAVLLAYIMPVILVVLSLWFFIFLNLSEIVAFALMLVVIGIYYIILYLFKKRIFNRINIKIQNSY